METNQRHIFKEAWVTKLTKGFDTYRLQIVSLNFFLRDIGYDMYIDLHTGVYHIKQTTKSKDNPKYMSLQTAVTIYNGYNIKTNGIIYECKDFVFDRSNLFSAWNNKILERVSLQRKGRHIHVQSKWIKFNYSCSLDDIVGGTY